MYILYPRPGAAAECASARPAPVSLDIRPRPPPLLPLAVLAVRTFANGLPSRFDLGYRLCFATDFRDPESRVLDLRGR